MTHICTNPSFVSTDQPLDSTDLGLCISTDLSLRICTDLSLCISTDLSHWIYRPGPLYQHIWALVSVQIRAFGSTDLGPCICTDLNSYAYASDGLDAPADTKPGLFTDTNATCLLQLYSRQANEGRETTNTVKQEWTKLEFICLFKKRAFLYLSKKMILGQA